jgi:hypothetical protein
VHRPGPRAATLTAAAPAARSPAGPAGSLRAGGRSGPPSGEQLARQRHAQRLALEASRRRWRYHSGADPLRTRSLDQRRFIAPLRPRHRRLRRRHHGPPARASSQPLIVVAPRMTVPPSRPTASRSRGRSGPHRLSTGSTSRMSEASSAGLHQRLGDEQIGERDLEDPQVRYDPQSAVE